MGFTKEAKEKLQRYYGCDDLDVPLQNHLLLARRLLELGRDGGYIFAPAHDVEGDVSLENMLAMIETVQSQKGHL